MRHLYIWFNTLVKKHRELRRWQRIVTVLAAVMTFVTTYALILPAITVERDNTENVGGMYLEQEEDQEDMLEENATSFTGICIAADRENAVAFEYADDGMTATAVFSTEEEIPEGAELVVNPVDTESEEYADLSGRAIDLLDKEFIYDVTTCSFYDFALICDGVDVTPKTGLVDVQINFMNNTVEHFDDVVYAGRFGRPADLTDSRDISNVDDELVSSNPDESSVIEFNDGIITVLSLKGSDLALTDSAVGILAGNVDEEAKAAAAETNAGISDHNVTLEEDSLVNSAETEGEADPAVKTMEAAGDDYTVILTYDESSKIPDGAFLTASEISQDSKEYKTYLKETKKALGLTEEETLPRFAARFFDIKIMVGEEEFTPKSGVSVEITYAEPLAEKTEAEVSAVHFADKKADAEVIEASTTEIQDDGAATVEFTAESFSVYGVIYTVDFRWEVDGKEYDYSLAGGSSVSLSKLLEVLHVVEGNEQDGSSDSEDGETDNFIDDIENVRFSDESLVKVAQITEGITAGALKEKLGLECEYSAELTEAERSALDSKVFYAPDWALISLKSFNTEEYLTVNMKDGEEFRIKVTDAQIQKDYISASGETYTITVTYGEEAEIPDGADLKVEEILPGTEDYYRYMQLSSQKLNLETNSLSFARFFDITIIDGNGEKVEPKTPVQVEIAYKDGVEIGEDQSLKIVHFAENGTEIISDATVSDNGKEIIYEQSSFSVTGTIVGRPSNGQQRMIVLKDGNRYYIVNNDATLTEVGYEEKNGTPTVSVVEPMLWTFGGNNIYFSSEATGFNTNYTASDFYRRYLNPASAWGTTEEVSTVTDSSKQVSVTVTDTGNPPTWVNPNDGQTVHVNSVTNRQNALSQTSVTIDTVNGVSTIKHGDTYFGFERDENGTPVRLVPQTGSAERAQFVFAEASEVPSGVHLQNAVNHIDIAINSDTETSVPLAYGRYYLEDGTPVDILENTTVTLNKEDAVDQDDLKITADDMKRATIMAYDKDGNELNDAFYITGFSQNATTNLSEVQVRIEGAFKVAQPEKDNPNYETIDGNLYDGNWWAGQMPNQNYVNAVRRARLNNKIDYRITVIKPVTYHLVDSQGRKLYIDQNQTPLNVSVDVAFSGQFNYWDYGENEHNYGNECPPLENNPTWRAGDIPNHDLSGMDFRLKGSENEKDSPLVAVEIMKRIVDEKGNLITLGEPVKNYVDIYENKDGDRNAVKDYKIDPKTGTNPNRDNDTGLYDGYELLRGKEITVEAGTAQALIYDYNVSDGMYYIQERNSENELPDTIIDNKQQEWTYVKTYIETEYVRRGYGGYDDKTEYPNPMHISDDYTRGQEYKSSPEVVGWFRPVTGEPKKSGFLEFYIYNVYTQGRVLDVEKQWILPEGETAPDGAVVEVELYYAKGQNGQFPEKDQYQKVVAGTGPFAEGLTTTVRLTSNNRWKDTFTDLPLTMTEGSEVYDLDYYAVEKSVKVPGIGKTEIDDDAIDLTHAYKSTVVASDGKITFKNEREDVSLDAEKVWAEGTNIPAGAEVTVELRYATRTAVTKDGEIIPETGRDEWQAKSSYAPVKTTAGYADPFKNDPRFDETKIVTELTLSAEDAEEGVWKDVFTGLPKYLIAADGSVLEVDYYAEETAVRVPAPGRTVVDSDSPDVKDDYLITIEKKDPEGQNTESSDGTVTITNKNNVTQLNVEKIWAKGTVPASGTEITASLRFAASMVTDKDGHKIEGAPQWPEKKDYAAVSKGQTALFTVDTTDPDAPVAALTITSDTTVKLKEDKDHPDQSWAGVFTDLPKYARDAEGNTWELDYYAVETAVKVPGEGVDATPMDVTNKYIHVEVKAEPTGTAAETSDGTVTITNKENTVVKVKKIWEGTPLENASATVQLKRLKVSQTPDQIKTEATVVKVWDDGNNQDGIRPESLNVTLTGGDTSETVTLNSQNKWTATVSDLQAYTSDGDPISYTWTEDEMPEGYSLSGIATLGNVTTLTNSYTPGKTSATVSIIWEDDNDRDALRPDYVEVMLVQNGQRVRLSEDNNWTETVTGLPEKANGEPIEYTWSASTIGDYTKASETAGEGQTRITYAHTPETTEMKVRLEWDDTDDEDEVRPERIIVSIENDPTKTVIVNQENAWSGSITLPKNENGEPISYSWQTPIIAEYTLTETTTDPDGTVVMKYHHELRPKKDYVTVTVHVIRREAPEGHYTDWDANGWNTNIWGTGNNNKIGILKDADVTDNTIKTERGDDNYFYRDRWRADKADVYFDVDKNSDVGFHFVCGGTGVEIVSVNNLGDVVIDPTGSGKERDFSFTTGEQDIDIYIVLKGDEAVLPDHSSVQLAVGYSLDDMQVVKSLDNVPLRSDISFGYDSDFWNHGGGWVDNSFNPRGYKVYYNNGTGWIEDSSVTTSGDLAGDKEAAVTLGIREQYLILISGDKGWSNHANFRLEQVTSLNSMNPASLRQKAVSKTRSMPNLNSSVAEDNSFAASHVSNPASNSNSLPAAADSSKNVSQSMSAQSSPTDRFTVPQRGAGNETAMTSSIVAPTGYSLTDYSEDTAFNEGTDPYTEKVILTLNSTDGWEQSFPAQDKYDKYGRPYIYYVEEIAFTGEGFVTGSITGDPNNGETVTVNNILDTPKIGSISVTKNATGLEAGETKTYQIGVKDATGKYYNLDGTEADTAPYYVTFSSNETKTWSDLPVGTYEVVENREAAGVEGYSLGVSGTGDITVTGGGTSSTTVTNTYTKSPGNLELTKKVAGDGADATKEFDFAIELTSPSGKTLAETYQFTKTGADGEQTLTLSRTDGNTKATVSGIKLKANDVYTIIGLPAGTEYKITEADYSSDGYSSSLPAEGQSGTITGGTTAKESVEVTNTLGKGSLTVEKTVDGNASDSTKDFKFSVVFEKTGLNGISGSYKKGTAETIGTAESNNITFANGSATVTFTLKGGEKAEFTDLPNGTAFTVSETSKDADGYETTVSSTGGTVNDSDKTVTGSISSTAAVTASYINTRETTTVEASKEWKAGEQTVNWPEDVDKIEFTLYKTVNGQISAVSAADAAGIVNPVEISSTTEGKKAVWNNLPTRYLVEGTWYDATYTVKETKIVYNEKSGKAEADREVTVGIAATANAEQVQGTHQFTVTNVLEPTSIHVTKEWKNKDDQVLDGASGKEIPAEARVKFTLYNGDNAVTVMTGGQPVNRAVELNGQDATKGGTVTPDADDYEANWVAYFTHLPKYDADGQIIAYTVRETGTWTGYTVVGSNTASNEGKITNKEKAVTLDIVKVEKDSNKPLENAVFKLYKIDETSASLDQDPTTEQTATTNDKGQTSFSNLTIGYYIVTETNTPTGYVITGEDSFYIEVTDNGIVLLTKGEGAPNTWEKNAVSYGNVKTFTAASTEKNAQATVENTPGAALPHTGGSGTMLYYLMGLMLIAVAGIGAVMKLRLGR